MPGPQNAILGDEYGIEIPETAVDDNQLVEEQKAAKYAKSHEYKKLKAHWEARIKYYQTFLPDGRLLTEVPKEQRQDMWLVANTIIAELNNAMNYYETAREMVEQQNAVQ